MAGGAFDGRYESAAAVKLLNASLIGLDAENRFRREGRILARLRHAHIAQLIDAGVSPAGQPYLVLEHIDGEQWSLTATAGSWASRHGCASSATCWSPSRTRTPT